MGQLRGRKGKGTTNKSIHTLHRPHTVPIRVYVRVRVRDEIASISRSGYVTGSEAVRVPVEMGIYCVVCVYRN